MGHIFGSADKVFSIKELYFVAQGFPDIRLILDRNAQWMKKSAPKYAQFVTFGKSKMGKQTLAALAKQLKNRNATIRSGKFKACKRHFDFFASIKKRVDLDHNCPILGFTSSKLDAIVNVLKEDFLIASNSESADYIMKVLLPETLIKITMDHYKITHPEAEEMLFDLKVKS